MTTYAGVVTLTSAPLTHLTQGLPRRPLVCSLLLVLVLGSLGAAASRGYWWLLAARVLTALAQALFWSVVTVTAVSLFPPAVRGRVVGGVLGGSSLAIVLGVPAGTWLGQEGGWRLPFLVLSALGAVILVAVALLLPDYHPAGTHASSGSRPSRGRYRALIVSTSLVVAGLFTAYTYVSPFLTHVARLAPHDVAPVLLVAGASGTLGVVSAGALLDRHPRLTTIVPVGLMTGALLGLFAFGHHPAAAIVLEALTSVALGGFVISNQNRVLTVAPGSTDVASAWASASFNLGIAGGSLAGSVVVAALGVRDTPLVGGLLAAVGLVVVLADAGTVAAGTVAAGTVAASPTPPGMFT